MTKDTKKEKYIIITYFILQLIYVYAKGPCVSVSDEYTYKQIALDIFNGNAVSSFHYPFVYPFLLSFSFNFGDSFYYVMLLENILTKSMLLIVIFRLLKPVVERVEDRELVLALIAFSPSYFLYSDWIMAENFFAPLLIITILYYIKKRYILVNNEVMLKQKILYSIIAGFLSVILYETKYLAIILIPIWFIFWFSTYLPFEKTKRKLNEIVICIGSYIIPIIVVLGGVILVYCVRSGQKIDLEIIKSSLGFNSGSGPENTGYKIFPQMKWIICYLAYAFLQTVIIFGENVKIKLREIPKSVSCNICFMRIISFLLIFVAARHSSLVDYNTGGGMLKLLGRYVTYITLIEIIIWGIQREYYKKEKEHLLKIGIRSFGLVVCTVFCYAILYEQFLWSPAQDWLASLRGLENLGFLKIGKLFLIITCILIVLLQIFGKRILILCWSIFAAVNIFCSIDANEFYSDNHDYIFTTKELITEYGTEQVTVYSTDMENYIGSLQSFGFLYHNQLEGEIWFLQAGFTDEPININKDRINVFTINKNMVDMERYNEIPYAVIENIESDIFYLLFDKSFFKEIKKSDEININETDNDIVITCNASDSILIINENIMPYKYDNGTYVYYIDKNLLDEKIDAAVYNFSDLTLINIQFKEK